MFSSFRHSMTWVHTWFGLVLGYILMVAFFFGALSVFDREIDRWSIPETRFDPQPMPSFDKLLLPALAQIQPDKIDYENNMPLLHDDSKGPMTPRLELPAVEYWAYTTHRDPVLLAGVGFSVPQPKDTEAHNHIHGSVTLDPRNGNIIPDDQLKIGSGFFFPLHYGLTLSWKNIGYWLVGLSALAMLIALITGVVIHRKLFREFFTFRPQRRTQRSTLDLHNMTGVVALPFHFFFAFTGLLIFANGIYFPVGDTLLKPAHLHDEVIQAERTGLPHEPAGIAAPMSSVDAMVEEAQNRWEARGIPGAVGYVEIHHLGDANAYVSIYRSSNDRVAFTGHGIHFKASNGEVLREEPPHSTVSAIHEFLEALHFQHFEHWMLRWLYVIGGLLGCICIATGFIFFVEKRKQKHSAEGSQFIRIIDALAVTTVTGMIIATMAILIANRLLPADMAGKGDWEINIFWSAWILVLLHALQRSRAMTETHINPAWREQSGVIAIMALVAVALNWITTGDHLFKTLLDYRAVAGVDLSLLVTAALAIFATRKLAHREGVTTPANRPEAEKATATIEVSNHG